MDVGVLTSLVEIVSELATGVSEMTLGEAKSQKKETQSSEVTPEEAERWQKEAQSLGETIVSRLEAISRLPRAAPGFPDRIKVAFRSSGMEIAYPKNQEALKNTVSFLTDEWYFGETDHNKVSGENNEYCGRTIIPFKYLRVALQDKLTQMVPPLEWKDVKKGLVPQFAGNQKVWKEISGGAMPINFDNCMLKIFLQQFKQDEGSASNESLKVAFRQKAVQRSVWKYGSSDAIKFLIHHCPRVLNSRIPLEMILDLPDRFRPIDESFVATPLGFTVLKNRKEAVQILLEKGATLCFHSNLARQDICIPPDVVERFRNNPNGLIQYSRSCEKVPEVVAKEIFNSIGSIDRAIFYHSSYSSITSKDILNAGGAITKETIVLALVMATKSFSFPRTDEYHYVGIVRENEIAHFEKKENHPSLKIIKTDKGAFLLEISFCDSTRKMSERLGKTLEIRYPDSGSIFSQGLTHLISENLIRSVFTEVICPKLSPQEIEQLIRCIV